MDYGNVTELTDTMAGHKLTKDQGDYFELQCRLVEDYEAEHLGVAASTVTGLEALRHLLDEHRMSGADLSRLLGAHRTLAPMILRGERKLTIKHIHALCAHFGVSANLLLSS